MISHVPQPVDHIQGPSVFQRPKVVMVSYCSPFVRVFFLTFRSNDPSSTAFLVKIQNEGLACAIHLKHPKCVALHELEKSIICYCKFRPKFSPQSLNPMQKCKNNYNLRSSTHIRYKPELLYSLKIWIFNTKTKN